MDAVTFDAHKDCRGHKCDRLADCSIDSTCHYRSSADEARAVRAKELDPNNTPLARKLEQGATFVGEDVKAMNLKAMGHDTKTKTKTLEKVLVDQAKILREHTFNAPAPTCNGDPAKCATGGVCDNCETKDEFEKRSHLEREKVEAQDFEGLIDGLGIKTVMFNAKSPLQLITPEFLEGVASVLQHGAKKYAPNNWMRGMAWETVMGGVLRHLTAFRRGEEVDAESGLKHLHHAACGLMFLSWYANGPHRDQHEQFDDRGYKTPWGTPCV